MFAYTCEGKLTPAGPLSPPAQALRVLQWESMWRISKRSLLSSSGVEARTTTAPFPNTPSRPERPPLRTPTSGRTSAPVSPTAKCLLHQVAFTSQVDHSRPCYRAAKRGGQRGDRHRGRLDSLDGVRVLRDSHQHAGYRRPQQPVPQNHDAGSRWVPVPAAPWDGHC